MSDSYRILVTGSREWGDWRTIAAKAGIPVHRFTP